MVWCVAAASVASVAGVAQQAPQPCKISGRVVSGSTPLPGVSLVALASEKVVAATSTELDGRYAVFGQVVGTLLDRGFGYGIVFTLAGSFHVIAFVVLCVTIPIIAPVRLPSAGRATAPVPAAQ